MISLYRYQLPFSKPFVTGMSTTTYREGVLIRYLDNSGDLWAEASPLPGFSNDSFDEVSSLLAEKLTELNTFFTSGYDLNELNTWLDSWPQSPSLQYALSFLGLRVLALREKRSLSSYFPFDFSSSVQLNDVLGITEPDEAIRKILQSRQRGFSTFKCKADDNPGQLVDTLKSLAREYPDIRFRVDANQSWPAGNLKDIGAMFEKLPIEYVEEPAGYQSIEEQRKNISALGLPAALDESIQSFDDLKKVKSAIPEIYVVIKPALYGSIFKLAETISSIRSKRTKVVFSTLLESKIGRDMTLFCAALLGDPKLAHGLNTGHLFKKDLRPDFDIRNGQIETDTLFRSRGEPIRYKFLNALNGIHS
jgi:O-succinylbenzoate synthase